MCHCVLKPSLRCFAFCFLFLQHNLCCHFLFLSSFCHSSFFHPPPPTFSFIPHSDPKALHFCIRHPLELVCVFRPTPPSFAPSFSLLFFFFPLFFPPPPPFSFSLQPIKSLTLGSSTTLPYPLCFIAPHCAYTLRVEGHDSRVTAQWKCPDSSL